MTFTSLTFLIFFPLVFLLHWVRQNRGWQNAILVLASYFFYGWWDYRFCALMLFSSLIDYGLGIYIANAPSDAKRRFGLILSVVCNLGLLGFFKYFNFFSDSLVHALGELGWHVHPLMAEILLPVGISFYTFQTLSYTIDIYRGQLRPTKNLVDYLAFVSFFPQLVAGPIERATNLIPQFSRTREFDYQQAVEGCRYILWGFIKKLIVADRLASVVDAVYDNPADANGLTLLAATVFFAFQIYCDFSAYSDIAIGTAKMFGIDLMRNFNYPYFSKSVTDFWRRWHISLSTWFRDYVFIPLGGSRGTTHRTNCNLMITFVLSGLWHGAAWRFLFWGAINGTALVAEKSFAASGGTRITQFREFARRRFSPSTTTVLKMVYTFSVVCLGWVFFRADTIGEAFKIIEKILLVPIYELNLGSFHELIEFHPRLKAGMAILLSFVALEWFNRDKVHPLNLPAWPTPLRWATYTILIWGTLKFMLTIKMNPFIYFTF